MVPVRDPVIVPVLLVREPVIVPPKVTAETDSRSVVAIKICPKRFMILLLVNMRLLGMLLDGSVTIRVSISVQQFVVSAAPMCCQQLCHRVWHTDAPQKTQLFQ